MKTFSIRLPEEVYNELQKQANSLYMNKTQRIIQLILQAKGNNHDKS